ncbi:imidazole glycerol phosphate synthase subunit HisH [Pyrofollis japonicus]|uniref:imidazole glycerol phosphate synthase subunit HisH n=1 Tax=Pyrofollis japonicus TaxID=3060460 RepID=UPI00295B402C|nr:imidazole glycerol phosphate synthase subunit HisH [Pyrofollis japonicus]BEP17956.1 imidazole glycerol phosphate synthase subunit HisH [Pyrofollis japonicus]
MRILVLKYGVGNIYSVKAGFERLGVSVKVSETLRDAGEIDALILPGVGAYPAATRRLREERSLLNKLLENNIPVLGICLGMQLFFEESEEGGRGLGLLPGRVTRLRAPKLPHIGWTRTFMLRDSELLRGVENGSYMYYVHSYAYTNTAPGWVKAYSAHGESFAAVIEKHPLYGTQFHPERSGRKGSLVLRNFVEAVKR